MITCFRKPIAFDSFEFTPSKKDSSKLASIQFNMVPDWELDEYRPEVRKLWRNVREVVKQYFKTK
ncbi:MAG TPA: hypothetical protein ENG87_04845 [Candidatus Pacearchaeota archaeon]|nr:hypothetical protein BMS3Abin17_00870 [archaeon BMS3Abin17]HDK42685.1 hypothetical protein [Candidatus Pacearchaeota archaeon]HDZ61353.1 hypothetical protein [Candidatus Pacearchaeota archaeon]